MKGSVLFVLSVILVLFLSQCGKKKKENIITTKEAAAKVEIPKVSWEKSIAIFPFSGEQKASGKRGLETVITEGITSMLSKSKRVKILSFPSEEWIDSKRITADYILSGKFEKENGFINASFRLVDTQKNLEIWNTVYKKEFQFLSDIIQRASREISGVLGLKIDKMGVSDNKSVSLNVMKLYIDGKSHLLAGTRAEIDLAIQSFKRVLRIDSTFTPGYVGLAKSYLEIVKNRWNSNIVWLKLSQGASLKAVQLDSNSADAHLVLGETYLLWGDFKKAEKEFRKVLRINPNLPEAWAELGKIFIHYGLYEPGLEVYEKALSLNPGNVSISLSKAMVLTGLKKYSEAEEEIKKILLLQPDSLYCHSFLALLCYYQGNYKEALKEVKKGMKSEKYQPFSHAVLAMIYAREEKSDLALEEVELNVKPYVRKNGSLATAVAAVYALLKRNGQAVQWLKKAVSFGYKEYPWIINDPNFESLYHDNRFIDIMKKMKAEWEK